MIYKSILTNIIKTPAKPNSYTYSYYKNDHLGPLPQPLRFAGQYHDSESNLYYNWHRYYNPKLGRYISSDPIGLDGGMNRFGYVGGNPLIKMDFEGLKKSIWRKVLDCLSGGRVPRGSPPCSEKHNTICECQGCCSASKNAFDISVCNAECVQKFGTRKYCGPNEISRLNKY